MKSPIRREQDSKSPPIFDGDTSETNTAKAGTSETDAGQVFPDEQRHRFEAMYQAHRGPVLGYVLRRTRSPDDAADVIAETFLAAWRRMDEMPPDPGARLWLYGVAGRVLANHHRGERRRSALADRLRADLAVTFRPAQFGGHMADVYDAFRRLPEPQRELLALSAWEGLDYGEIAVVLGCSRNAVRIRLHRARKQFSAELSGHRARTTADDPRKENR